LYLAYSDPI